MGRIKIESKTGKNRPKNGFIIISEGQKPPKGRKYIVVNKEGKVVS